MKHPLMLWLAGLTLAAASLPATAVDKHDKNYFCETNCQMEFKFFREYARQGSPLANLMLAIMYYKGKGTEINIKAGNSRLLRSANANEPAAQYQLGYLLMHGLYLKKDLPRALMWFTRAANNKQYGAREKIIEVKKLLNRELDEDDLEPMIVDAEQFADSTQEQLDEESQLADLQLCQVATNRKAAEVIALFHDKGITDADEMREYAIDWDMANWGKSEDLGFAESAGVTMEWECVKNAFMPRLSGMIEKSATMNDDAQFKQKYADIKLLSDPLSRVYRVRTEVDRRDAIARAKRASKAQKDNGRHVEVITISAGFSYAQLLNVAKNQTCNAKCDPPWQHVVAPLIVLSSDKAREQR